MVENRGLRLNWQLKIEQAHTHKLWNRGRFYLVDNDELLFSYDLEDKYNLNAQGRLAKISRDKVTDIFCSKTPFWAPVLDDERNIYIPTSGSFDAMLGRKDPGTLYKLKLDGTLIWEYPFDRGLQSLPVPYKDSVFIYDFLENEQDGNLNRLTKDGELIWKKNFKDNTWYDPYILEDTKQIVLGQQTAEKMLVLDMAGNVQFEKWMGHSWQQISFSRGNEGELYVCAGSTLYSFDTDFNTNWVYRPEIRWVPHAPVTDSNNYLYCLLTDMKLTSLDSRGQVRWIVNTAGDFGFQPMILNDGNILMVTVGQTGYRHLEIRNTTFVEIFSTDGEKLLEYSVPGSFFDAIVDGNNLYFAIDRSQGVRGKDYLKREIMIYSSTLS